MCPFFLLYPVGRQTDKGKPGLNFFLATEGERDGEKKSVRASTREDNCRPNRADSTPRAMVPSTNWPAGPCPHVGRALHHVRSLLSSLLFIPLIPHSNSYSYSYIQTHIHIDSLCSLYSFVPGECTPFPLFLFCLSFFFFCLLLISFFSFTFSLSLSSLLFSSLFSLFLLSSLKHHIPLQQPCNL